MIRRYHVVRSYLPFASPTFEEVTRATRKNLEPAIREAERLSSRDREHVETRSGRRSRVSWGVYDARTGRELHDVPATLVPSVGELGWTP